MTELCTAPTLQSILLTVAYDGSSLHGFAMQPGQRTVAGELLAAVRELDPSVSSLRGASRTDAGVHARGQLVAFDSARSISTRGWVLGISSRLARDISVRSAAVVPLGFAPRKQSAGKHYRYTLLLDVCRDPFLEPFAWRLPQPLDLQLARAQASALIGTHDFAAFRSSADGRTSTERTIHEVSIVGDANDPRLARIDVRGTAFLHNMVRIIVGSVVDVARGALKPGAIERALASGQRSDLGMTAPACGLCLEQVALIEPSEPRDWWPEKLVNREPGRRNW